VDARGFEASGAIGEKGHGTKIYFNSRKIELRTVKDDKMIEAVMDSPRQKLQRREMPRVEYSEQPVAAPNGTNVTVLGYNGNSQGRLGHDAFRDYILHGLALAEPRRTNARASYVGRP
jgi:hypothetical protein